MTTSLLITSICIISLSQYSDAATPQRQRLTNLEYVYRYGTSLPIKPQTFYEINNAPNFLHDEAHKFFKVQQQESSIKSNEIESQTNEEGVYYNNAQSQPEPRRPYWMSDAYHKTPTYNAGVEQPYQIYPNSAASVRQSPALTSHIIYAPRAQYYNQLQASSLIGPFSQNSLTRNTQQKVHSNQKQYAPKRPPDFRNPHHAQLPYPPSFISITSTTSTTAAPPRSIQNTHSDQAGTSLTRLPDIFAARQHKSLLDSYIPSWVLIRMLQQQKLLQTKRLHQFIPTHTLAYPSMKKNAQK